MVRQQLRHIALVVPDYDEALAFFCGKLHFTLVEDSYQPEQDKRWVVVAPPGSSGTTLLLARASTPAQVAAVGNQTGGRVFLFLQTDDFWRDYEAMRADGIRFVREPKEAPYGTVAVFEDAFGNLWDLVQTAEGHGVTGDGGREMHSSEPGPVRGSRDGPQKNLTSISPFFIVRDLQTSVSHYVERFGFQLDFQGPPGDVYYAHVSRDGVGIMLKAIRPDVPPRPNHTRHEWARWDAYVYTLDPDTLFAELKQRGASFVKELSFIDDGLWGFEVTDADGYVLAFFRTRK